MKYIFSLIVSGALVVSGFGQTRNVLVGTNNTVIQPTNFWSADSSNARAGLGLGSAATNPATAFQSSSVALSNLAINNGGSLTNLQAASLIGVIPSSNIATVNFSNVAGTLSISSGGTSATNAADARQNLGSTPIGDAVFIATNEAAARSAIGALAPNGDGSLLTNIAATNITGTVALASNLISPLSLTNGGTGATNAAIARTNLGLGWSALTNTDATSFRNAIGLGTTNIVEFGQISSDDFGISNGAIYFGGQLKYEPENQTFQGDVFLNNGSLTISGTNSATKIAATRTNLGLPWEGLTNTNAATFQDSLFGANTNPVLVDTNGEVVSPTNFWQAAPIATALQNSAPNATNTTATNARLLFLFSLTNTTVGVTNTFTNIVQLPTNGNTFNGDVATITHNGGSNTVTAIRQLGATNNIITLNQPDETVRFLYRNDQWELMDNISYIEPIYFSGTNAAANAAASRTNLGLGWSALTNTNAQGFYTSTLTSYGLISSAILEDPDFAREDLGIPLPALTNTNNANFQAAVFVTNTTPAAGANLGDAVAWMEVTVSTNGTNSSFRIPLFK